MKDRTKAKFWLQYQKNWVSKNNTSESIQSEPNLSPLVVMLPSLHLGIGTMCTVIWMLFSFSFFFVRNSHLISSCYNYFRKLLYVCFVSLYHIYLSKGLKLKAAMKAVAVEKLRIK